MLGMGQHRELCRGFKHCCAGFAASSVVWLQMKAGLGFRLWNFWAFSLANYQGFCESVAPMFLCHKPLCYSPHYSKRNVVPGHGVAPARGLL